MKKAYDKEKQRNEEISIPKRPLRVLLTSLTAVKTYLIKQLKDQ